jgi:hypothetical protein
MTSPAGRSKKSKGKRVRGSDRNPDRVRGRMRDQQKSVLVSISVKLCRKSQSQPHPGQGMMKGGENKVWWRKGGGETRGAESLGSKAA